jgi:hypothetical protein
MTLPSFSTLDLAAGWKLSKILMKFTDSEEQAIKNYMSLIGHKGGAVKSLKKQEAGRLNMAKARKAKQNPVKAKETALPSNSNE